MRTSKPISTISYNSKDFLEFKLIELLKNHVISDYMFIYHFREDDETKNHFHVWLSPNKLLDTMDLQNHFIEHDFEHDKPLKCIDFRSSDIDEWILYCMHYAPYLASKGQSREYHYKKEDFSFYDYDTFNENFNHAFNGSEWAKRNQILQSLCNPDISPVALIESGAIPLNQACQINALLYMRSKYGVNRNGRVSDH